MAVLYAVAMWLAWAAVVGWLLCLVWLLYRGATGALAPPKRPSVRRPLSLDHDVVAVARRRYSVVCAEPALGGAMKLSIQEDVTAYWVTPSSGAPDRLASLALYIECHETTTLYAGRCGVDIWSVVVETREGT